MRTETPLVEIVDLVKRYPGQSKAAVDGLQLTIEAGEIFGLLGPNGAGKTTTLSILCGLLPPSAGALRLQGHDVQQEPTICRTLLGFVPQDLALYETLSVQENLHYFGSMTGLHGKELTQRIDECLQMTGLQDVAHRQVRTFSGGMKRRANLAVGVIHKPALLLLDEPTVGVDVQSRNTIFENLRALNRDGMTILYTTHYMEEAQQLCTRVAIIDQGKRLAQGTPQDLIDQHPDCANLEQLFLSLTGKHLRD